MEVRLTDADGFERHAASADLAILLFTREEVEAQRVGSAVERLMLFSDSAENVRRYAGRMTLMFSGYDDDPRPLVQIPECVMFFRAIDRQWSYWLHFLRPDPDVLNLAMLMLLDVQVSEIGAGQAGYALRDPMQLHELLKRLFLAMNVLHDTFGIPQSANEAMTAAALTALGAS